MPKYKKYQNGSIELRTKTLDLDKLPKTTNTSLKLYINMSETRTRKSDQNQILVQIDKN